MEIFIIQREINVYFGYLKLLFLQGGFQSCKVIGRSSILSIDLKSYVAYAMLIEYLDKVFYHFKILYILLALP